MKRLPFLAVPRFYTLFLPSSYLLPGSGFSTSRFPVLVILLTLSISLLLVGCVVQPAAVAGQDAGNANATASPYNTSVGPVFTLPPWTDGTGWDEESSYATIQLANIDGDSAGAEELLGRGYHGMMVYKWDATLGLWNEVSTSGPFSNSGGWNHPEYYSTIQTADIDGDGSAELLGRGVSGMYTYKWDGTNWQVLRTDSPAWTDAGGWSVAKFYSTIQTADIDGNPGDELLARGINGMETYKWSGSEWTLLKSADPFWADSNGWGEAKFYSTIQTADIDGEPGDELLARGINGMDTYKWSGSEWKLLKSASPGWSDAIGWEHPQFYSTIQMADIDGDGKAEMLGRSGAGMETYKWNGTAWDQVKTENPGWSDEFGWDQVKYYATIQTADIDGDKAAELLGRVAGGMETYKWDSDHWVRLNSDNPQLADNYWDEAKNYTTIQTGDVDGDTRADLIARGRYGIRTWSYDKVIPNAWDNPVAFGFPAFTAVEADAYAAINNFLTVGTGQTIRDQYTTDANTLSNYQTCLFTGTNDNQWNDWTQVPTDSCMKLGNQHPILIPTNTTLAAWNIVAKQIYDELGLAQSVSDYFTGLSTLYSGIFTDDQNILTSTAKKLYGEDMAEKSVDALYQEVFLAPFALSSLGGDVSAAVGGVLGALIGAGLDTASSDSFQGKWAAAQKKFNELSETNKDSITNGHAFVASDASLLNYVAQQKDSGAWDPSDTWVTRSTKSEGRKQFALWIYQTLSPSIWQLQMMYYTHDDFCTAGGWPDTIQYYFVDKNADHDCVREVVTNDFSRNVAPSKPLEKIMNSVSPGCTPMQTNRATWEYGICNLGVPKEDFFLNRDGWNFKTFPLCESPEGCDALSSAVGPEVAPGDSDNTIKSNH
ncbi:hypothetical protein ACTRXD_02540 [Nitrospira sp. T9]|uniref:hypothetical protein n=1 Tax=unclassified Nitrospira TaxID=2652172 RepID=UPI003F9679C2